MQDNYSHTDRISAGAYFHNHRN